MLGILPALALPAPRPNIVLILADDLGYREVGAFGQKKIPTPHIDRLAREGARLTRMYANSPVCAPTRASLLTGRHQGRASIRGNREIGGWGLNEGEGQFPLPAREVTLAELLRGQGYATAAVGKWGLGGPASEGRPRAQGFDFFFGYLCQRQAHNFYPTHLWRNDDVYLLQGNRYFNPHPKIEGPVSDFSLWTGEQYAPDLMEDQALDWLAKVGRNRPYFLYFASPLPHASLQAPRDRVGRFPGEWDAKPYLAKQGYVPVERPRATYAAMIARLDESVGRILAAIRARGEEENTVVIFSSDNGTAYNAGVDREFFDSLGELRGHKGDLWEGGVRVPTLIRWPGRIPAGRDIEVPLQLSDLLPTFAEWTGAKAPRGVTGLSLDSVLTGAASSLPRRHLYFEFGENPSQSVLLDGRWKAIRPHLKQTRTVQLYDLERDPGEKTDLARSRPDLVRRAETIFGREHLPNPDFPLPGIDKP